MTLIAVIPNVFSADLDVRVASCRDALGLRAAYRADDGSTPQGRTIADTPRGPRELALLDATGVCVIAAQPIRTATEAA